MHTYIYTCISLVFAWYFWIQLLLGSQFAACQTIPAHQLCSLEKPLDITGLLVQLQYFLCGKSDILGTFMDDLCLYLSLSY